MTIVVNSSRRANKLFYRLNILCEEKGSTFHIPQFRVSETLLIDNSQTGLNLP